jgi:hypothetical protein
MLRLVGQILLWLRGGSLKLLVIAGLILLAWGVLAPVGTLVWWVQQGARVAGLQKDAVSLPRGDRQPPTASESSINCYIIFLTGVGDFSANQLAPGEERFLDRLVQSHPNCVAVRDVFPYSAANESLGGRRFLAPLWRFAQEAEGWLENLDVLIKIRNLWRFAISLDDRYGSVYNQGIASAIVERIDTENSLPAASEPFKIILIGTSGGAQVALGASEYLDQWLDAEILLISIGGVFSGTDGFNSIEKMYHLRGKGDWVEDLGAIFFASRWSWTVGSPFNQARRQGDYTVQVIGSQAHDGDDGYFGSNLARPEGVTHLDVTVQAVNQLPIWSDMP